MLPGRRLADAVLTLLLAALLASPAEIVTILSQPLKDEAVQQILAAYTTEPVEHIGFIEDRDYYVWKKDGLELIANREGVVTDIYLRPGFRGAMPHGLDFRDTRAGVAKLLGHPDCHGEANYDFEVFEEEAYTVHVEYDDGAIKEVTLMTPRDACAE